MHWYTVTKWLLSVNCTDTGCEGLVYVTYKCLHHLYAMLHGLHEIYKPCPNQSDYSIPSSCALTRKIHVLGMYLGGEEEGEDLLASLGLMDNYKNWTMSRGSGEYPPEKF